MNAEDGFANACMSDIIAHQAKHIEALENENRELRRDKERLDKLQKIYADDLKRNPEVPFGLLTVALDRNYSSLRNALDAIDKSLTKAEGK